MRIGDSMVGGVHTSCVLFLFYVAEPNVIPSQHGCCSFCLRWQTSSPKSTFLSNLACILGLCVLFCGSHWMSAPEQRRLALVDGAGWWTFDMEISAWLTCAFLFTIYAGSVYLFFVLFLFLLSISTSNYCHPLVLCALWMWLSQKLG